MLDSSSRFSKAPSININRSVFPINWRHKTTFNAGKLVPLEVSEILPGDTISLDVSSLVRMATPINATMDDAYLDIFAFFVPNRLTWEHWVNLQGENTEGKWYSDVEYTVPTMANSVSHIRGGFFDHAGIPPRIGTTGPTLGGISALPLRGYQLIWNEWFRDENLQDPILVQKGDIQPIFNADDYPFDGYTEDSLLPVNKLHDYFTSALPSPQKGEAARVVLEGSGLVYPTDEVNDFRLRDNNLAPMGFYFVDSTGQLLSDDGAGISGNFTFPMYARTDYDGPTSYVKGTIRTTNDAIDPQPISTLRYPIFNNLVADLTDGSFTINDLRLASAVQRVLERDARSGTRYFEVLNAHFSVSNPDARLQRPEFLGARRIDVNVNQIIQTSNGISDVDALGTVGGYSKTADRGSLFTKSFTEHGYLYILGCVRNMNSYQQGYHKHWRRSSRFDFYMPEFANIGETPVYNYEIYAGTSIDDEIFGYQEAWAEYRYHPSTVSGGFRAVNGQNLGLDSWHYADYYESTPTLSADWIQSSPTNIDRTLAITSQFGGDATGNSGSTPESTLGGVQFIGDFYFKTNWTRPMPVYSIPGLEARF